MTLVVSTENISALSYQERSGKGLSVAEVAYKADIDSQNLRKYELGKQEMKVSMLIRIAKALDVKPKELLDFET